MCNLSSNIFIELLINFKLVLDKFMKKHSSNIAKLVKWQGFLNSNKTGLLIDFQNRLKKNWSFTYHTSSTYIF